MREHLTLSATGVALSGLLIAADSRPLTGGTSVAPELLKKLSQLKRREIPAVSGRNSSCDVRFGSQTDISERITDVRFAPESGHHDNSVGATTSSNQPDNASNISDLMSASLHPARAGTWKEWSASSNSFNVARVPSRSASCRIRRMSASASLVPCKNSIGISTSNRCSARSSTVRRGDAKGIRGRPNLEPRAAVFRLGLAKSCGRQMTCHLQSWQGPGASGRLQ